MISNVLTSLSAPLSVNLEVTDKCNFSCPFCFNAAPSYMELMAKAMQRDELERLENGEVDTFQVIRKKRLLRIIDELAIAGVFEIRFFGGEFTVFKYWREIMEYAAKHNFFISFVSNGYLFTEEDVECLVKYGVRNCTISIHGPEQLHDMIVKRPGSFRKVVSSVKLLLKHGIRVSIAYTPVKENIDAIYEFVQNFENETGARDFSISRLFNDDRYENLTFADYRNVLETIHRCRQELGVNISLADSFPRCSVPLKYWPYLSYCSQGVTFGQIDFEGNLKHCSATGKPLGNLLHESITTLWREELKGMRVLDHLPSSCKICPIFCGGGCIVSRGVEHKFAPDQFIPWPQDENLAQAVVKTIYNRIRKTVFIIKHKFQRNQNAVIKISKDLHIRPFLYERYCIRREGDGFIVMFEKTGVRMLSPLGAAVLKKINGARTIQQITQECNIDGYTCDERMIVSIIKKLL